MTDHTHTTPTPSPSPRKGYRLTRHQLLFDLFVAYYCAAMHKHKMAYVVKYDRRVADNLNELCDDLLSRRYEPQPSKCFVVKYPKKREVFAAMFRDRIVHHLYFRYTHQLFERTFIQDSYSCIEGRGTHYGISRMASHIRQASLNYSEQAYALSIDIRGYFMHIDRQRLLSTALDTLSRMSRHRIGRTTRDQIDAYPSGVELTPQTTWRDIRDMDFLAWLTEKTVMLDPQQNCQMVGDPADWDDIDPAKTMRYAEPGRALPIGNLTSQLLSNVYMNPFDQFVKRTLKCRHYGRYVDDAILIDTSREWLAAQVPTIREFLADRLGLALHAGKLHIGEVHQGQEFLGAFVREGRTYMSSHTIERITERIGDIDLSNPQLTARTVNSYLGLMRHTESRALRERLFGIDAFREILTFDDDFTKSKPRTS